MFGATPTAAPTANVDGRHPRHATHPPPREYGNDLRGEKNPSLKREELEIPEGCPGAGEPAGLRGLAIEAEKADNPQVIGEAPWFPYFQHDRGVRARDEARA
jgi:hypothetical protein